ncbi:Hypothetical predicted protein [Octopus vulgaris]|uniref:Uncharacterized protein n=1 Tax=Octopus vulgaris TaxID=6645 RepID=A0AA36B5U3_OCTVU|nr:Hypothetical predicted protein [Octopus vulgaris]
MTIPAQSSLLHTTPDASYVQHFSQGAYTLSCVHIDIIHPADHTNFISFEPMHVFSSHGPCFTAVKHGNSHIHCSVCVCSPTITCQLMLVCLCPCNLVVWQKRLIEKVLGSQRIIPGVNLFD